MPLKRVPKRKAKRPATKGLRTFVKKVIDSQSDEKHYYFDNGSTAVTFTKAGLQYNLSPIAQGQSDNQRIADQVRLKSLLLNMRLVNVTPATGLVVRVLIYRYKPLNSASVPVKGFPLESAVNIDYLTAMSPITAKARTDFVVLKDINFTMDQEQSESRYYKLRINMRNVEQIYTGDYSTNQIFLEVYTMGLLTASIVYSGKLSYYNI